MRSAPSDRRRLWIVGGHPQARDHVRSPGLLPGRLVVVSAYERVSVVHSFGETQVLQRAARAAEDAGDFRGALRLVRGLPADGGNAVWLEQLEIAEALPSTACAQLACWLVNPALRWALGGPVGEVLEAYARLMLATLGVRAPDRNRRLANVAAADRVVADAGLFDGGVFDAYLPLVGPQLLARVGPVAAWSRCPSSIWQVVSHDRENLTLHDCWTGEDVACVAWPGALPAAAGTLLYGRLVPVAAEVPLAFALAPTVVDSRCAARVLRARQRRSGPDERLRAVAHSRRRGGGER
jgi:hypothetical protein